MKRLLICLSFLFHLTFCIAQQSAPVILVAGQSNADGRVSISELPANIHYNHCRWSYGSGDFLKADGQFKPFSPTVARTALGDCWGFDAVVYYLLEQQLQCPFYVIKQTMGGTAIDTACTKSTRGWYWSVDAQKKSLLKAFEQQIDDCLPNLPKNYDIKCLIWHQGESDQPAADRYPDSLTGYYRTSFTIPKTWKGQQIIIRLDGVLRGYDLWLNDQYVGTWESGYNTCLFDLTPYLTKKAFKGEPQQLAMRVYSQFKGYEFDCFDDWVTMGIFRDVTLFPVPETHLSDLTVTTKMNGEVTVKTIVANATKHTSISCEILDADGRVAGEAVANSSLFTLHSSLKSPFPSQAPVYAPHYPATGQIGDFYQHLDRPVIFTEYCHTLGISFEDHDRQWEIIERTPGIAGGSVWEWAEMLPSAPPSASTTSRATSCPQLLSAILPLLPTFLHRSDRS